MALSLALLLAVFSGGAAAFTLGRITVQSALGELLRAEIEVVDLSAEEAASLRPAVAAPGDFGAAGLAYNPALARLQMTLQKSADGRSYISLSSTQAISDPFLDLLLEINWASGRLQRSYTLLLDPPTFKKATVEPPIEPPMVVAPGATNVTAGAAAASPSVEPARPVQVKAGDTAGRIVLASKPVGVSLDQMLVALLRANPDAFIDGNVNRVRVGAVLDVPDAQQARSIPGEEARQIIVAQSRDFNAFRRRLAAVAPRAPVGAANRKASGKIEAKVQDNKPHPPVRDKLTLSKGASVAKSAEDKLARQRDAQAERNRTAELSRNIKELNKLGAASSAPALASSATAKTAVATASKPALVLSAPIAKPAAVAAGDAASAGLLAKLLGQPLLAGGAGVVVVLLLVLVVYRWRRRSQLSTADAQSQPDSLFGAGSESADSKGNPASESVLEQADAKNQTGKLGDQQLAAFATEVQETPAAVSRDTVADAVLPAAAMPQVDLDLNLDLNFEQDGAATGAQAAAAIAELPQADAAPAVETPELIAAQVEDVQPEPEPAALAQPAPEPVPAAGPGTDLSKLEFDLDSISLDLEPAPASDQAQPDEVQRPLETKLALAQEFRAIGDDEGARALLEEVIAEASGELKAKAQRALAAL